MYHQGVHPEPELACEGELVCQIKKDFVIPVFKDPL